MGSRRATAFWRPALPRGERKGEKEKNCEQEDRKRQIRVTEVRGDQRGKKKEKERLTAPVLLGSKTNTGAR